jgi:pyrroloquinoline-quinone synthase
MTDVLSPEAFEAALRAIGAERYHSLHPFHRRLHGGGCTIDQVRAWALNRYCYQAIIPQKDAALMARCEDRDLRREWLHRITDHDGLEGGEGGIDRWLMLTDGLGFERDYVMSRRGALPATRFATQAYLTFVKERTLLEAVASSLTELFAPKLHEERISGMLEHYDFINDRVVSYFRRRLDQAPRDASFALDYVKRNAVTAPQQQAALAALTFKTDVLWAQLDALWLAYVDPVLPAPGAWQTGEGILAEGRAA